MKKEIQLLGIILLAIGLSLVVGMFQLPYCLGYTQPASGCIGTFCLVPQICVGITINLGFYFGILLIVVGVVVYLVGRTKRR